MTDRDPAPPRRPARAAARRPSPPAGTRASANTASPPAEQVPAGTALRDRWWWSPALSIVIGLVVVGYQVEPLRGTNPLWGNWVVAGLGLAVAAYGVVRLVRAARER